MILQDFLEDLTQDCKVFLGKILDISCQELTKNLAKSSHNFVGMFVQDLGKILGRSYMILSIFVLK